MMTFIMVRFVLSDINGSVGILFEQASSRGHAQESANGIITFSFTIETNTTSLSTLQTSEMRTDLLEYPA
jgi:hypothetical protein